MFILFLCFERSTLEGNYLRMYWTDLRQIFMSVEIWVQIITLKGRCYGNLLLFGHIGLVILHIPSL